MTDRSITERVHRNLYRTYDEAIQECVDKERELMIWEAFSEELADVLWPADAERPHPLTAGQLLEAVKNLRAKVRR